jgi:hypothetical protein
MECGVPIVPSDPVDPALEKLPGESGILHFFGDIFAETGTFLPGGDSWFQVE